jgi:hypothetical protein
LVVATKSLDLGNGVQGLCVVYADGSQECFRLDDPQYTDPSYSCPEGSTPIDGDPTHCLVTTSGYVYANRPTVPATYKCPSGYTEFEGGDKPCRKVDVAGHYITDDQPIVDYTCPTVTFSVTVNDVFYTITFTYEKSEDPHKCHRPSDATLGPLGSPAFSTWPGQVNGKFRAGTDEFLDATPVYGDCSTLGAGWETDPAVAHGCRKWVDTTYLYADKVVDVAEHLGDCPDGYEPTPGSDTQCRKPAEENSTIDAIRTGGTPYCSAEGTLVDGKCRVVVDCPPDPCEWNPNIPADSKDCHAPEPTKGLSCRQLEAKYAEGGHPEYLLPPHCYASGLRDWFQNQLTRLVNADWWPF